VKDSIEFYSQARTERSIRRANVVLFILDSREEITRVEKRLAQTIVDQKKICVIVANKWDLVADKLATEEYSEYVAKTLPGLHYAPIVFTTATEGRHVHSVIDVAQSLFNIASRRV